MKVLIGDPREFNTRQLYSAAFVFFKYHEDNDEYYYCYKSRYDDHQLRWFKYHKMIEIINEYMNHPPPRLAGIGGWAG